MEDGVYKGGFGDGRSSWFISSKRLRECLRCWVLLLGTGIAVDMYTLMVTVPLQRMNLIYMKRRSKSRCRDIVIKLSLAQSANRFGIFIKSLYLVCYH